MTRRVARGRGGAVHRRAPGLGPWVVFLLSLAGMFASAPVLMDHLGGFWSMAAFLPIWVFLYLFIHLGRILLEACHDRA